jgi:hypothetical protein
MAILFHRNFGKEYGHFMSKKKEKKIDWENLEPEEQLKYEIAEELGLLDRVKEEGWKSLSAKETGRIGGLMTRRKQEMKARALKGEQEEMLEELQ